MRPRLRWFALLAAPAACRMSEQEPSSDVLANVRPGTWVEAKGVVRDGVPVVSEVDEVPRGASDKPDKVEIAAIVEAAAADSITLLGQPLRVAQDTEWEDADKQPIAPFVARPGDWLRVKARVKDDGGLHARTVRASPVRDRFQVVGEVSDVDPTTRRLKIATIALQTGTDLGFDDRARAEAERSAQDDPLARFFADERKGVPFTVRPFERVWFGGELSGQAGYDQDFDLDRNNVGDRGLVQGGAKVDMLWHIDNRGSFALFEGETSYRHRARAGGTDSYAHPSSLSRAYAYLRLTDELSLQAGRQDFDEEREWLYDERLDGARLHWRTEHWYAEVGGAIGRDFADDDDSTRDRTLLNALVRYYVEPKWWLTAYWLDVDDGTATNLEPTLFGVRSFARPWHGLGHWGEFAYARGQDGTKDIDGWAFDVGLLYRFDVALQPSIYAGYAYAPGRATTDATTGFRQSGFQDNNAKFGGVTSFKYYGEVALPELSNSEVTTLGVGVRPGSFSADVVLHTYAQDYLSTTWVGSDLRTTPNGRSNDLGYEVDLVLGYRHEKRLTAEIVLGRFEPGSAFDAQDPAYRAEAQVRVKW